MDRSGDMGSPTPYARQPHMSRSVLLQNSQLTGPPDGSSVDHELYPRPVRELIGPLRTSTPAHASCQGSGPGAWRRSLSCASQISPPQSLHASRHTLLRDQGPPHSWPPPSLSVPGSLLPAPGGSLGPAQPLQSASAPPIILPQSGRTPPLGVQVAGLRACPAPGSAPYISIQAHPLSKGTITADLFASAWVVLFAYV